MMPCNPELHTRKDDNDRHEEKIRHKDITEHSKSMSKLLVDDVCAKSAG